MKCLTIMEPFGTLIAIGEKKIETRSWRTKYRGKMAIHTSKNINKYSKNRCLEKEFMDLLKDKYIKIEEHKRVKYNFNFGSIIAVGELIDCVKMKEKHDNYALLDNGVRVEGNEFIFGDYRPGRYAWIFENVQLLDKPIPTKGQLRLWNYDITKD
ncbi:MAG: ASCH domain-containing protein [Firmicutes bacterium]|nr:ASCH domain-containing protein [Bacillota bacterium]